MLQEQWDDFIQVKRLEGVREWTDLGAFDEKYRGVLDKKRVVGLGLGALSTVIDEEVPKELKLARAPPLFNTTVSGRVKHTPEELATLYYIAVAILRRAKRHFGRLLKSEGSKAADAYAFLEYNAIHEKQAEAEELPTELVRARSLLHLVFLSRPFLQFVVFLEALIGSNCSSTNLAACGENMFGNLEEMACENETLYKLFLEARHPEWLSTEMAHAAAGEAPDFSKELRPLFKLLIHKYRKVRQADFLKAHQCWVLEESEALRRRLKKHPRQK